MVPNEITPLGDGIIVYQGEETNAGGDPAVDFNRAPKIKENEIFLSVDISKIPPGTYKWIRTSLTYQKYDIAYRLHIPPWIINQDFNGTLASFVGFNTFITNHQIVDTSLHIGANKLQGYWAFETFVDVAGQQIRQVSQGDSAGVTVVNPISATSPIPLGSCVVTGEFAQPLVITGAETTNKTIKLSYSTNQSFEWKEVVFDGKFEPGVGETVVDMG